MWPKLNNFGEPGNCWPICRQCLPDRMLGRLASTNQISWVAFAWADVSHFNVTSVSKLARSFCASWPTTGHGRRFKLPMTISNFLPTRDMPTPEQSSVPKSASSKLKSPPAQLPNNAESPVANDIPPVVSIQQDQRQRSNASWSSQDDTKRSLSTRWNLRHLDPGTCQILLLTSRINVLWHQ